jgi:HAD superfamily hydrolase (TIGR01509 family)
VLAADDRDGLAAAYLAAGIPGAPYPSQIPDGLADAYARRDLASEAHRRAYVGLFETVAAPAAAAGLPDALYDQILTPDGWVAYADARAVVDALARRGLRLGLVSNVGFDIRPILRHHGLEPLARSCTLSYELGVVKPDPAIFRAALAELGTDPAATLMVGDSLDADGGAAALGIHTLILPMTEPGTVHGLAQVLDIVGGAR